MSFDSEMTDEDIADVYQRVFANQSERMSSMRDGLISALLRCNSLQSDCDSLVRQNEQLTQSLSVANKELAQIRRMHDTEVAYLRNGIDTRPLNQE